MEFYDVIKKRRTVRDFEPEDIPDEVIERIISAAMKAPTNMPDHLVDEWIKLEADPRMLIKESVKEIIAEKA